MIHMAAVPRHSAPYHPDPRYDVVSFPQRTSSSQNKWASAVGAPGGLSALFLIHEVASKPFGLGSATHDVSVSRVADTGWYLYETGSTSGIPVRDELSGGPA